MDVRLFQRSHSARRRHKPSAHAVKDWLDDICRADAVHQLIALGFSLLFVPVVQALAVVVAYYALWVLLGADTKLLIDNLWIIIAAVIAGDIVYFGVGRDKLYCVKISGGVVRWRDKRLAAGPETPEAAQFAVFFRNEFLKILLFPGWVMDVAIMSAYWWWRMRTANTELMARILVHVAVEDRRVSFDALEQAFPPDGLARALTTLRHIRGVLLFEKSVPAIALNSDLTRHVRELAAIPADARP